MLRSVALVIAGIALLCGFGAAAFALTLEPSGTSTTPEYGWSIERFDALYELRDDGSIDVTEKVAVDFGGLQRHGIFRDLAVSQRCPDDGDVARFPCPPGNRRVFHIDDFRVTNATGDPIQASREGSGDLRRWRIGDPDAFAPNRITYVIQYHLAGAPSALPDRNELYWNVTGIWAVPIEASRITVRFPEGVTPTDGQCLQGTPSRSMSCDASRDGADLVLTADGAIGQGEQLTIIAAWPSAQLVPPPLETRDIRTFRDYWRVSPLEYALAALVTVACVGGVSWAWWARGRDRRYRTINYLTGDAAEETMPLFASPDVVVEFLPPGDLRPGQMGLLVDESADTRDTTATLVDLAVRGYLTIEEVDGKKNDWNLIQGKAPDDLLLPYEQKLLEAIFAGRSEVRVAALKDTFAKHLAAVKHDLVTDAMSRHWFTVRPDHARATWIVLGFVLVALGGGASLAAGYFLEHTLVGLPIALAGIALLGFASHMPRRTARGSEALRRILGFRLYIETAETSRQAFNEQEGIFARYLPYAIVFNCVDRWASAFKGLENDPAQAGVGTWYLGAGLVAFSASDFSRSMNGFSNTVGSTFSSTPSSSGGGGGGFSGGGGGGGGGGSW